MRHLVTAISLTLASIVVVLAISCWHASSPHVEGRGRYMPVTLTQPRAPQR